MKFDLASWVVPVETSMRNCAEKATVRRLNMYLDEIKCTKGCSSCCSRMIYISIAEALVIQETLVRSGKWNEVRKRCLDQKAINMASNPVSWFKMNIKCPVLDSSSQECMTYNVRPTPCSIHFVKSNPKQCDPWETEGGEYQPISMDDIHDEFIHSMESCIDGHGILAYRMNLPSALLFAENIRKMVGLTVEEAISLMRSELR